MFANASEERDWREHNSFHLHSVKSENNLTGTCDKDLVLALNSLHAIFWAKYCYIDNNYCYYLE